MNFVHAYTNADTDWECEHLFSHKRCSVRSVAVANKGAAPFWLWVCDSPSTGATKPTFCPIYVPALSTQAIDWALSPMLFVHGLYVFASSDPVTKTRLLTNDAFFEATFSLDDV